MAKLMKREDESQLYNSLTISKYAFLLSIGCSDQMLKKDKWSKLVECVSQMVESSCEDDLVSIMVYNNSIHWIVPDGVQNRQTVFPISSIFLNTSIYEGNEELNDSELSKKKFK